MAINLTSQTFTTKSGKHLEIKRVDIQEIHNSILDQYFDIYLHQYYEMYPKDDPPPNKQATIHAILTPHPHYTVTRWLVFENETLVGYSFTSETNEKNPAHNIRNHIIMGFIAIHPQYRRQHIAKELLKVIVTYAGQNGKKIIQTDVYTTQAKNFIENTLKVTPAKTGNENRLYLHKIDWNLINKWIEDGKGRNPGVILSLHNRIPDDLIEEFCEIYNITSDQEPSGELEEQYVETSESRRVMEVRFKELNQELLTIITQEQDMKISSLTEILFDPNAEYQASQLLTGVKEEYRGKGLGKWIKASMLNHLKENYPTIKFVRTGNADLNAPMRSINDRLGFKTIFKRYDYNIESNHAARMLDLEI